MIGLPGEGEKDAIKTAKYLNKFNLSGIKLHSTYVLKNTRLGEMYLRGEYTPLELDDYIDTVIEILKVLNPKFIIHRISGDAPKETLLSPSWSLHKKLILNRVENYMQKNGIFQGMNYRG